MEKHYWFCIFSNHQSLVVPFLRLGENVTGGPHFPLTSDALKKVFTGQASQDVFLSIGNAVSKLQWDRLVPFPRLTLWSSKLSVFHFFFFYFLWLLQLLGWLVATPFFFIALYVVLMPCFKILVRKFGAVASTPKTPTSVDIELNPKPRLAWIQQTLLFCYHRQWQSTQNSTEFTVSKT